MSQLNTPTIKSRVLVGIPPFYSCKENCEECLSQRDGLRDRLQFHVNEFPNVDIAFTRKHHLKLFGFKSRTTGKYKVFTGGINFTCSDFNDVLVEVAKEEDAKILVNLFEDLWNTKPQPLGDISHWSLD